ncbi:MAG: cytochrome c biogenesis heme-transporting ATPase CcmA, partial [Burkholderiales bacterium]|nr:cytochrome c biogenesis heme-transporting ATPase CcmA [Burkholderiales bacterium]
MLEAVDLECVRGDRVLFSGLAFKAERGELLRIAGANGRGKTSLLRTLCGLLAPAQGEIRWDGTRIRRLREEYWRALLYIGHANAVKDDLTALENVRVACALNDIPASTERAGEALRQLGLAGCEGLPARVLSQGQRRRVTLTRLALGEGQPLWLLDEPFTALDVAALAWVREAIERHVGRGGIVIYTTHQDAGIAAARSRVLE